MVITKGIRLGLVARIDGRITDVEKFLDSADTENTKPMDEVNMTLSHQKIKYKNDIYYIFPGEYNTSVYKLLPNVDDDDMFHWKERVLRNRVRNQWCEVDFGKMTFNVLYYTETGNCRIAVQWNNNTIEIFHVADRAVDNKVIKETITNYLEHFKRDVENIAA